MWKAAKVLVMVLLLSAAMSVGQEANATIEGGPSGPVEPFAPGYEVVFYDKASGQLTLKFTVTHFPNAQLKPDCDTLLMTVYPFDGLIYTGPDSFWVAYQTENPYSTVWELTLPPQDTSYLVFREECGNTAYHYGLTFETTADTLVIRWGTGRRDRDLSVEWTMRHLEPYLQKDYERAKREWEEEQERLKKLYPPEGTMTTGKTTREAAMRSKKRKLELYPLTDKDEEKIMIGDTLYVRKRGETKFRAIVPQTMEEIFAETQRFYDSLAANPPDSTHDVILDLRDSANHDFAKSLLERLLPTDSAGFYRAVMNKPTLLKLDQHGIKFWRTRCWPKPCKPKRDTTHIPVKGGKGVEQETSGDALTEDGQVILFQEDFEGAWPGQWSVGDDDPGNGLDYWGDFWGTAGEGSWSCWCADEGDMPDGERYDDYMWAYMMMTEPVDLTGYVNKRLSYLVFYDTESGFDYFRRYASADGSSWVLQEQYSGNSGGWTLMESPIYSSGDYYVMFLFTSDYISSNYEGAYVDYIQISADSPELPNLTYYWPAGWDYPIVASPIPGTNTVDDLYAGEATYIDWAIINDGGAASGPFYIALYIDDSFITSWYNSGLDVFDTVVVLDQLETLSYGSHTLKIKADYTNLVNEEDETDNEFEITFWWYHPEITYRGYVYYWDMNPIPTTYPARYVTINLLDKDGNGYEQLGGDFTDQNGYFEIGPIPNDNDSHATDPRVQQHVLFTTRADIFPCNVRNTQGEIYQHTTQTVYNHRSGVFDATIQIPQDSSGPFFVADVILQGWDTCNQNSLYLDDIPVYLDAYPQTEYVNDPPPARIRISTLTTGLFPDTWDRDVIIHEYGHRTADYFDFLFSDTGQHAWDDTLTLNLASTEAWADFFAAWVTDDPVLENSDYNFVNVYWWNCENGEWGKNTAVYGSANNYGKYTEGAVAGILWDIFDQADDDYEGDNIWDTLWNGIDNILSVLLDRYVNGHHPDNIDEFWQAWFASWLPGHGEAMEDIWYEHGEIMTCCLLRGDVDHSGSINIADLTYLIDKLYRGGPDPPCPEEGDVDASGSINIADLTYLVDLLYRGGPPPPQCP